MPPRRKKAKRDMDVIRTEPDYRKADGREDENDFVPDDEEEAAFQQPTYFYTGGRLTSRTEALIPVWRRRGYLATRKVKSQKVKIFRFLDLPAEIRNCIYRYIVISNNGKKIDLSKSSHRLFHKGGIETAILYVNHQIFAEASTILYDENKFIVKFTMDTFAHGFDYRVDSPKSTTTTGKRLRSGTLIDAVPHTGLIHRHILLKLRHLEIHISIPDVSRCCIHIKAVITDSTRRAVEDCRKLFDDFAGQGRVDTDMDKYYGLGDKTKWILRMTGEGGVSLLRLYAMYRPLFREGQARVVSNSASKTKKTKAKQAVISMMRDENLSLVFEGQWPNHFEKEIFKQFYSRFKNFSPHSKNVFNTTAVNKDKYPYDDEDDMDLLENDDEDEDYLRSLMLTHGHAYPWYYH